MVLFLGSEVGILCSSEACPEWRTRLRQVVNFLHLKALSRRSVFSTEHRGFLTTTTWDTIRQVRLLRTVQTFSASLHIFSGRDGILGEHTCHTTSSWGPISFRSSNILIVQSSIHKCRFSPFNGCCSRYTSVYTNLHRKCLGLG